MNNIEIIGFTTADSVVKDGTRGPYAYLCVADNQYGRDGTKFNTLFFHILNSKNPKDIPRGTKVRVIGTCRQSLEDKKMYIQAKEVEVIRYPKEKIPAGVESKETAS